MRNSMMTAAILTQQWRINPAKLQDDFQRIFQLFPVEGANRNFLEMIVVYALNVSDISEAQLGETIKSIPEPIQKNIMTTYDRLMEKWKMEGELIGIQKGKTEGKVEGKVEVVHALFDEGFETQRIAKIVNLNEEEVWTILKEHGKIN
jgi:predicted transposase/invertase (TIGR01784 family)